MRWKSSIPWFLSLALGLVIAGCGAGRWGYARTYAAWGEEPTHLQEQVDLSYEEVRRFPDRHADELIGWFGIVNVIDDLAPETGEARLILQLRDHRDRHLCSDETEGSCRVTISQRDIGPFVAELTVRQEDLVDGPDRLWTGSLVKVYGHVVEGGTDESGPIIRVDWYRQWPHGRYVTTGAAGAMRR